MFSFYSLHYLPLIIQLVPSFFIFLLIDFDTQRRERDKNIDFFVPLIYAFTGCSLYVSGPGIEPATLAYWNNALTNWATQPEQSPFFSNEETVAEKN